MKCPKCKKSSELQTKRTMVNGSEVKRDRYCPRCGNHFVTIECFKAAIEASRSEAIEQMASVQTERDNLCRQLEENRDLFRSFKRAINEAGKK